MESSIDRRRLKKFEGLNVSSKFSICGLPIRLDTYKTCSFGCRYCFSNYRKIMEFGKELQVASVTSIEKRLRRVSQGNVIEGNLLDHLVSKGITWHCGGMSDPFQQCEGELGVTSEVVSLTNKHGIHILFSTKSDTTYCADIRPDLHTFQLSVTNVRNMKEVEPNVPSIERRKKFYDELKRKGFKVGIRIQPFIPNISGLDILEMFADADHFTIEGLKMVPQNREQVEFLCGLFNIDKSCFSNDGLYNLKLSVREELYAPVIKWLKDNGKSYSVSDNDIRYVGNNSCCCGDSLVNKSSMIDTTCLIMSHGVGYDKSVVYSSVEKLGCGNCKCKHLFTSNRCKFGSSVKEFFDEKLMSDTHPASPSYQKKGVNL